MREAVARLVPNISFSPPAAASLEARTADEKRQIVEFIDSNALTLIAKYRSARAKLGSMPEFSGPTLRVVFGVGDFAVFARVADLNGSELTVHQIYHRDGSQCRNPYIQVCFKIFSKGDRLRSPNCLRVIEAVFEETAERPGRTILRSARVLTMLTKRVRGRVLKRIDAAGSGSTGT